MTTRFAEYQQQTPVGRIKFAGQKGAEEQWRKDTLARGNFPVLKWLHSF
jgi:hypothetical protein